MKFRRSLAAAGALALLLGALAPVISPEALGTAQKPVGKFSAGGAPGWQYRRTIRIDNTGNAGALSDYPIKVVLDGSNFDFDRADTAGADLRFADEDGTSALQYWLQHYDPEKRRAIAWVRVPNIPSAAVKTISLYYGNPAPHALSNGMRVFDFFDDFGTPGTGYYDLSPARTVLTVTQAWEKAAPHTLSVVEVNRDGYRYWGYYGLTNCGGIGLARSNDLLHWDKYAQNPLYGTGGERWPSAVKVEGTYYMVHDRDYCTTGYLVLRSSTDGLDFGGPDDYTVIIPPEGGTHNQNANLFYDPQSKKFFLYWYRGGEALRIWQIRVRSATSAQGLADPASERVVIEEPYEIAAPHMLYYDNTYFLSTEINENAWKTRIYTSTSPLGPFVELPGNPVLGDNEACFFQHVFSNTLHAYYCKDTGAGWVVNYRTADLSAGRNQRRILDVSKWGFHAGGWTLLDSERDPARGIVLGGAHAAGAVMWSSAFSGTNYTAEVAGRLISGTMWSMGVRADDDRRMLRLDMRADGRIALAHWENGRIVPLAEAVLDRVDLQQWFTVTVGAHGAAVDVSVNGAIRLRADHVPLGAGRVALISPAGTSVQFDEVMVRKYAPTEPLITLGRAEDKSAVKGVWFGVVPTPVLTAVPSIVTATMTTAVTPDDTASASSNAWLLVAAATAVLVIAGFVWLAARHRG